MTAGEAVSEPSIFGRQRGSSSWPTELRGTVLLFSTIIHALFDTGASHSFISRQLVLKLGLRVEDASYSLVVQNPMSGQMRLKLICPLCSIHLGEHEVSCDFIVLDMTLYDRTH